MFEGLQSRLDGVFRTLRGEGTVSETVLQSALREIRLALLEADVHFKVVKSFVTRLEDRARGERVLESLTPEQQVVKIVRDELVALLGEAGGELALDGRPPVILLCGLQGSGKTTTAGKLARRLQQRGRHPLLVACDLQRPAAIEQLAQLGAQIGVPVVRPQAGDEVLAVAARGLREARDLGRDAVILDTAGRLHVDAELMDQVAALARETSPSEALFVADAMTGQDAVRSAEAFAQAVPLTGVVLTKLDGDTRGGAALSVRAVTGQPIRFLGMGEKADALEPFDPGRMASRILGMGDVLSLIEKAEAGLDAAESRRLAERLSRDQFTLEDLRDQLRQIRRMGPLGQILSLLPKAGPLRGLDPGQVDERELVRIEAIINSMTPEERRRPAVLNASRRKRIARGSGTSLQDINRLVRQHKTMQKMMKSMKKSWLQKAFRDAASGG